MVTALALLAFIVAVFTLVLIIARFLGMVAEKTRGPGTCPHGRPLGNRTKNFCAHCAMEKNAADEIHARLRAERARRAAAQQPGADDP